jgi:hypothetical protein
VKHLDDCPQFGSQASREAVSARPIKSGDDKPVFAHKHRSPTSPPGGLRRSTSHSAVSEAMSSKGKVSMRRLAAAPSGHEGRDPQPRLQEGDPVLVKRFSAVGNAVCLVEHFLVFVSGSDRAGGRALAETVIQGAVHRPEGRPVLWAGSRPTSTT